MKVERAAGPVGGLGRPEMNRPACSVASRPNSRGLRRGAVVRFGAVG